MNTDDEIDIQRVANGWIVRPSRNPAMGSYMVDNDHVFVFQSFIKLIEWLDNHFTKPEKDK